MRGQLTWSKYAAYWGLGIAATLFVGTLCLLIDTGATGGITLNWPAADVIGLRLTRVGSAALVGAALAAAGVLLQALLRNPLADPYVLGISTGSSVGVLIWVIGFGAIAAGLESGTIPHWMGLLVNNGEALPAVLGALASCVAVFGIARATSPNALQPLTLLLVGVVVSAFNGALIILLNSLKPQGVMADITVYLIGHISDGTSTAQVMIAAAVFAAGWAAGLLAASAMNVASLSDTEAASLGLRIGRLRTVCFVAASVMTAAAIALARSIAFVGLICPHVCRLAFGPDHRQLMVTAPFCGAVFLMLADAGVQLARPIFPHYLPVGVVTALAGGPFFLILLRHRERGGSET